MGQGQEARSPELQVHFEKFTKQMALPGLLSTVPRTPLKGKTPTYLDPPHYTWTGLEEGAPVGGGGASRCPLTHHHSIISTPGFRAATLQNVLHGVPPTAGHPD